LEAVVRARLGTLSTPSSLFEARKRRPWPRRGERCRLQASSMTPPLFPSPKMDSPLALHPVRVAGARTHALLAFLQICLPGVQVSSLSLVSWVRRFTLEIKHGNMYLPCSVKLTGGIFHFLYFTFGRKVDQSARHKACKST